MTRKNNESNKRASRRTYDVEFKAEAVQMMLDGHSAQTVAENLGLSSLTLLDR